MGKCVIADLVPLAINTAGETAKLVRLDANQKESCGSMLALQDIENLRRPVGIGTVVKGNRELRLTRAITRYAIRQWKRLEDFTIDQPGWRISGQIAPALRGARLDAQDLTLALHVHILAGRNFAQLIDRTRFA